MINITRGQIIIVALVCLLGIVMAAPNLLDKKTAEGLPGWMPGNQISLGLDLQGGAHLLMKANPTKNITQVLANLRRSLIREFGLVRPRIFARIGRPKDGVKQFAFQLVKRGGGSVTEADVSRAREAASRVLRTLDAEGNALVGQAAQYEITISDNGQGVVRITAEGERRLLDRLIEQAISVVRRRIDETGVREPVVQRQGTDRILVQVPGISDPEQVKELIGKTAKMTFHLVNESLGAAGSVSDPGAQPVPGDTKLVEHNDWERQQKNPPANPLRRVTRYVAIFSEVRMDGERLADANQGFDRNGLPAIDIRLDTRGAGIYCDISRQYNQRRFAIVLDNKVLTAPQIVATICDGSMQITGGFVASEAQRIALLLRAGALPIELEEDERRTVGPQLGQDNIDAGKLAAIVGMVLVVIFMAIAYGRFGLMANVALLLNLVLIAGALSFLQATLTLPGIAGIVLTIGMAVDANVLIFERIREEVRSGRTPMSAIDTGYRRAMTTIIDSNLTTFIAATLLFLFGSGPIQGFGVTLAIGLATSMFTAIMVTRLLVVSWWRYTKPQALPI